jgi:hypothetical protein
MSRRPARLATERPPIDPFAFDEAPAMLRTGDVSGLASLLQLAAKACPAFGRAARVLLGSGPGRHVLDDDAALAEMARTLATGETKFVAVAARRAAAKLPRPQSLDSAADRLEKKYRKKRRENIITPFLGRDSA